MKVGIWITAGVIEVSREYVMTVTGRMTDADREALGTFGVEIKHETKFNNLVVVLLPDDLDETRVSELDFVVSLRKSRTFRLV